MLKIMTIVGTRPEIIKMSRVIAEFDLHTDHTLVHTGQNYDYELNDIFFKEMGIRNPDYFLNVAGGGVAQIIARIIERCDAIMAEVSPDAILIYGDTNSCLSVISAKRRKIPIFHMEAGNRCFDERVPEEINRKVIDHLSDINLVLTEHARRYLISEGIKPETIFKTGSHMSEVLDFYSEKIKSSKVIKKLELENKKYFVVSVHREESIEDSINLINIVDSLNSLASEYEIPIIVSLHPRTKKRLSSLEGVRLNSHIQLVKPLSFFDYIHLQMESLCVLSDSGTITEEASLLNIPAVILRNIHERPEGMDYGVAIMSGLSKDRVLESVKLVINQRRLGGDRPQAGVFDYRNLQASKQILRIVMSYIDYVNRTVWKK